MNHGMKADCENSGYRVLHIAAALALASALAACGEKPAAQAPTAKIESAADVAARQAQQAAAAAEKKKTEEQKKAADEKTAADTALAGKVKAAVLATHGLKNLGLDVRSSDGEVTLFGTADTKAQRRQAEKVAAGVPGVKSVKDELQLVRGS